MVAGVTTASLPAASAVRGEPLAVRLLLIGTALAFLLLFLVLPLVAVFVEAVHGVIDD